MKIDFRVQNICISNCRITFQVGDVLLARIRACVARPGLAKCDGAKHHKGRIARLVFCGTRRRRTAAGALTVC